jgi:hypothetical protein
MRRPRAEEPDNAMTPRDAKVAPHSAAAVEHVAALLAAAVER